MVNQRRSANQPSMSMTAVEVAEALDVSKRTVYAYASRGLLGTHRGPGLEALYDRSAVERLAQRSLARKGHAAVAAGALRWGEPVLQTALTELVQDGPRYRGVLATSLTEHSFERVARFFWSGTMPSASVFARAQIPKMTRGRSSELLHDALLRVLLSMDLPRHVQTDEAEWLSGEKIVSAFVATATGAVHESESIATSLSYDRRVSRAHNLERALLVNLALILMLDHELNASTFAARTVAGVDASLVHCIAAGVCALAGPRHGSGCDRIELMLHDDVPANGVAKKLREQVMHAPAEGFYSPPCYPHGDPRAAAILARLSKGPFAKRFPKALAYCRAGAHLGLGTPSVDLALVALSEALAMPRGMASALFAIARTVGFVGHVLEQRKAGPIRPRAGYRDAQKHVSRDA